MNLQELGDFLYSLKQCRNHGSVVCAVADATDCAQVLLLIVPMSADNFGLHVQFDAARDSFVCSVEEEGDMVADYR